MTAPKKDAPKAPQPKRHPLGAVVVIPVETGVRRAVIERPDGSKVAVRATNGRALYVLTQAGVYISGEHRFEARA